jgi:uncharacterized protein (TIGR00299 family) protein
MRMIFLDCSAGIAGDMLLAALIDVGASLDYVRAGLDQLPLTESWELRIESTMRRGISAQRAVVIVNGELADTSFQGEGDEASEPHRHHSHGHNQEHSHGTSHHHAHEHSHNHRPYAEIKRILNSSTLPPRVLMRAQQVFAELAKAEGAVHGVPPEEVHFHEVGSTDAIIDIVGCCLALESLDVGILEASPLHLGRGFVTAAHGRMPIPAPATLLLLEGLAAYQTDIKGELVTPTGAALVRGLCRRVGPMPLLTVRRVGHGAGARDREIPNVVRAILAHEEDTDGFERDEVRELSANIDDMNPQLFAPLFNSLFEAGALDVWVETAVMKKSRPGHVLHVLVKPDDEMALSALVLRETTSLGIRSQRVSRLMLSREWINLSVSGENVRAKIGRKGDEVWNVTPEYDDCVKVAQVSGKPVKRIIDEVKVEALLRLEGEHGPL